MQQGNPNLSSGFQNCQICCYYCGRPGHHKDICLERLVDIRKLEADRRTKLSIKTFSANIAQDESWTSFETSEVPNVIEQPEEDNFEFFEAALSSLDIHNADSVWYLDSGATQHISSDCSNFTSLDQFSGNVKTAGGQSHQISGKGSVHFTLPSGEIKDINGVLYVPGLSKNLLSIGSLTDKGIIACFDDQKCILYSKGNKRIVTEGLRNKQNGLYQLSALNLDITANLAQTEIHNARLWHHRLGHIGYDRLHDLTAKRMATGIPYIPTYTEVCN